MMKKSESRRSKVKRKEKGRHTISASDRRPRSSAIRRHVVVEVDIFNEGTHAPFGGIFKESKHILPALAMLG